MIGWKNKEFVQNYISEPQKKMFSKITIKKKKILVSQLGLFKHQHLKMVIKLF